MFTLDISAEHMFSMLIFALPYAIALLEVVLLLTGYSASQLTSGRHLYNTNILPITPSSKSVCSLEAR